MNKRTDLLRTLRSARRGAAGEAVNLARWQPFSGPVVTRRQIGRLLARRRLDWKGTVAVNSCTSRVVRCCDGKTRFNANGHEYVTLWAGGLFVSLSAGEAKAAATMLRRWLRSGKGGRTV